MMKKIAFVPQLCIRRGTYDINFYEKAFGAEELRRWSNDDGSIHVAEMSIDGAMFHLHEEVPNTDTFCPDTVKGVTTIIGLMVPDVDTVMKKALEAGARLISAAKSYDYGYRQGEVMDPFGHLWLIEMVI